MAQFVVEYAKTISHKGIELGTTSAAKIVKIIHKGNTSNTSGLHKALGTLKPKSFDIIWGGTGAIVGTVKIDATPDYPVSRMLRLYDQKTGKCLREVWSDTLGNYSFTDIKKNNKFIILAYDSEYVFRAVAIDQIEAS